MPITRNPFWPTKRPTSSTCLRGGGNFKKTEMDIYSHLRLHYTHYFKTVFVCYNCLRCEYDIIGAFVFPYHVCILCFNIILFIFYFNI